MGDTEEFTAFVAAHQTTLRRTAYLVCGDWDLASDHVQEGLIRLFRRWRRLERDRDPGAALRAYARKAVVSAALDSRRRRSSHELATGFIADDSQTRADEADRVGDRDALLQALATLGPRQRACVVLRHYEDLSVSEVADLLGTSEGTVKSQTARGLAALQAVLPDVAATDARDLGDVERSPR